ncbi:hypothetical protein NGM07_20160 (plasmid) [Halorussus vallis]|nr:hypothetical protein [Halorussus vallis]USZ78237.1 hypothetical protein NGM07_20160 [Halorussus vallis]
MGALLVDFDVPLFGFLAEPPGAELEFAGPDAGRTKLDEIEVECFEIAH